MQDIAALIVGFAFIFNIDKILKRKHHDFAPAVIFSIGVISFMVGRLEGVRFLSIAGFPPLFIGGFLLSGQLFIKIGIPERIALGIPFILIAIIAAFP